MSEQKFIKITSDAPEDIKDLFNAICHDVLKLPVGVVKRRAMGFIGKDSSVERRNPSLIDILKLCQDMDIPYEFSLKLRYEDSELTMDQRKAAKRFKAPDLYEGYREPDLDKRLEEQANQLTNEELKYIERSEENKFQTKSRRAEKVIGFRPGDIQEFKL